MPAIPPPRPAPYPSPTPAQILSAARTVMTNQEPVLDGRRSITAAALARQALELSVEQWLVAHGARSGTNQREAFLCLAALHPDPALARRLHDAWAGLSTACHAISYELPPIASELERWMGVIRRFIDEG